MDSERVHAAFPFEAPRGVYDAFARHLDVTAGIVKLERERAKLEARMKAIDADLNYLRDEREFLADYIHG